jgi:hypothetical protein
MHEPFRSHFLHVSGGDSFPVDDPVTWCLENARAPLLERARQWLLLCDARTDPQRALSPDVQVATVRHRSGLVTVHPGDDLLRPGPQAA